MKNKILNLSRRGIALVLAITIMLSVFLSGCQVLKDLATDFVWVNILNDKGTLLSESDNNEEIFTYQIEASITNGYVMPLTNVVITLNVPGNVEVSKEGEDLEIEENTIEVDETLSYNWIVKIPMEHEDQSIEYSISIVSDVSSEVEAYGSLFVEGKNTTNNRLEFDEDIWSFENYSDTPVPINQTDYESLMVGLSNVYRQRVEQWIPNNGRSGGYCFGMSSTAILVKTGKLKVGDIYSGANSLFGISKNKTSKSVIGYYHISQTLPHVQDGRADFLKKNISTQLSEIEKMCEKVKTGGSPVLLDIYIGAGNTNAHTVVAYSAENGKFEKNNKEYNSRILIYDCNNKKIKFDEDYCLYYNNKTWEWCIPKYPNASGFMGAFSNVNDLDYKNIVSARKSANSYIISRTEQDLSVYNSSGVLLGNVTGTVVDNDKIVAFRNTGGNDGEITIAIPKDKNNDYVITNKKPEIGGDLDIMYDNFYLSAKSDKQEKVSFYESGKVQINGETSDFTIGITANEGFYTTDWYEITVEGDSGKNPKVEVTDKGYVLSGEDLKGVTVRAENDKNAQKMKLKTDEEIILITQDGKNLCAKSDEDNDGQFETILATGSKTDLDDPTSGGSGGSDDFGGSAAVDLWVIFLIGGVLLVAVISIILIILLRSKKKKKTDDFEIPEIKAEKEEKIIEKIPDKLQEKQTVFSGFEILSGNMTGRRFELENGKTYMIGKDPNLADIILDKSYAKVSRIHCTVVYSADFDKYFVIDTSSNGTRFENGARLTKNTRTPIKRGTVLQLADNGCIIRFI